MLGACGHQPVLTCPVQVSNLPCPRQRVFLEICPVSCPEQGRFCPALWTPLLLHLLIVVCQQTNFTNRQLQIWFNHKQTPHLINVNQQQTILFSENHPFDYWLFSSLKGPLLLHVAHPWSNSSSSNCNWIRTISRRKRYEEERIGSDQFFCLLSVLSVVSSMSINWARLNFVSCGETLFSPPKHQLYLEIEEEKKVSLLTKQRQQTIPKK